MLVYLLESDNGGDDNYFAPRGVFSSLNKAKKVAQNLVSAQYPADGTTLNPSIAWTRRESGRYHGRICGADVDDHVLEMYRIIPFTVDYVREMR